MKVGHAKTQICLRFGHGSHQWIIIIKKWSPWRTLEDRRHPRGSADFDILCRPRTALPWYAILFQSKCQTHWLIRRVWEHGDGGSSSTRLLHYFFNEELLTLLHKQAELWPETLSLIFCKCKWRGSNSKWRAAEGRAGWFIIRHIHGNDLRHGFTPRAEQSTGGVGGVGLGLFKLGRRLVMSSVYIAVGLTLPCYCTHNLQNQC